MQNSKRVLVIGLDGATWDVLDPWINDGSLPNLARLRQSGSWGQLFSSLPPLTAAAWSNFMTGKRPGKHGLFHFINLFGEDELLNDEDIPALVNARDIKSSTLWDILGHYGRKVGVINVPMTYPPRPVNGFMVSCFLTPKNAPVFTYPPELTKDLKDYIIDLDRFIDKKPFQERYDPETRRTAEEIAPTLSLMEEFREMTEKRARTTFAFMESQPWDVFMVVFISTDRMGHYLWPFHRPANDDDSPEIRELCRAIHRHYMRLDEIIGELVKRAGQDVSVIVMSDHGMGPKYTRRLHCSYWLYRHGWLSIKAEGTQIINPDNWLRRLGVPRDKIGRLMMKVPGLTKSRVVSKAGTIRSATVDLEKSQAYCQPMYNNVFGICVNLNGEKKETLRQEIMQELRKIVDPETGQPVVRRVYRSEDYYYGPYANNVPDIVVAMDPDYGCNARFGYYSAAVTRLQNTPYGGSHRLEGIFITAGPEVIANPGPLPNLAIEDVAPTVLYLIGLPVPEDMDGRVLTEIVTPTVLASRPVEFSQPIGLWPNEREAVFIDEMISKADEAEIRERLQALGYLE